MPVVLWQVDTIFDQHPTTSSESKHFVTHHGESC